AAGDEARDPQVSYSGIRATAGGVHTYVPGKWGILQVQVTNPLDQPHEFLSSTYFVGEPTLQYGRRVWVPARSRLNTWQPVLLPQSLSDKTGSVEFRSLVIKAAEGEEVLARDDAGEMLHSGVLPAQFQPSVTGVIESLADKPQAVRDA